MSNAGYPATLRHRGFTLIEMMVAVTIVAILAAMAAPSLRELMVRNQFSSVGNEFSGSVMRARNEAINRNSCVTMCMSASVDDAEPSCATTGQDWQAGWIVFLNPKCTTTLNKADAADDMIMARRPAGASYQLNAQANVRKFTFDSQGRPDTLNTKQFNLVYESAANSLTTKYGSNICIDGMGRVRSVKAGVDC